MSDPLNVLMIDHSEVVHMKHMKNVKLAKSDKIILPRDWTPDLLRTMWKYGRFGKPSSTRAKAAYIKNMEWLSRRGVKEQSDD